MTCESPLEIFRPFLWIAAIAFLIGFSTYSLFGYRDGVSDPAGVQQPPIPVAGQAQPHRA